MIIVSEQEQRMIISANLNKLLSEYQMTQKDLADAIGESTQTVNKWCTGKAVPRMGKVQKIADYFNVAKSKIIDVGHSEYFFDDEVKELVQFLHDSPEYKVLFDASRNIKKDDIVFVVQMLKRFGGDY